MLLEVQMKFSECDGDWEVNVWDREDGNRVEDLEGIFASEKEASEYVDSLAAKKEYDVIHVN